MENNLLSTTHIVKLGHHIEEIRIRALSSVVSKFNLKLVDENDLDTLQLLLDKLLAWFNFENVIDGERVLKLVCRILVGNNYLLLHNIDVSDLMEKLHRISNQCVGRYSSEIENINCHINTFFNSARPENEISKSLSFKVVAEITPRCNKRVSSQRSEIYHEVKADYNENLKIDCEDNQSGSSSTDNRNKEFDMMKDTGRCESVIQSGKSSSSSKSTSSNVSSFRSKQYSEKSVQDTGTLLESETDSQIMNFLFKWQCLVTSDRNVLSSVYDGLRYVDNSDNIIQSTYFFKDVLLKDFPAEVFVQRPLILTTFLELMNNTASATCLHIANCLKDFLCFLKIRIQCYLDPSLQHFKDTQVKNFFNSESETASCESPVLPSDDSCFEDSALDHLQQYNLTECCLLILKHSLQHLSRNYNHHEFDIFFTLVDEAVTLLVMLVDDRVWSMQSDKKSDVKEKLYYIMTLFEGALQLHKRAVNSTDLHIYLLNILMKLLNAVVPVKQKSICQYIPRGLQLELINSTSSTVLLMFYPQLHANVMYYVSLLPGQLEFETMKNYKDSITVCKSMISTVKFLKHANQFRNRSELLKCLESSLPSLEFHGNVKIIHEFMEMCFLKFNKKNLDKTELEIVVNILLKLLSFNDDKIKCSVYRILHEIVECCLGVKSEGRTISEKMSILFHRDILCEIICYGLNSTCKKIHKQAEEIILYLLKSKPHLSQSTWEEFIDSLLPNLGLLQCFGDKTSRLGRYVTKLFDPDQAKDVCLSMKHILIGNLRFLFSRDSVVREEAISRLCWILTKEEDSEHKLPKLNLIQGLNMCNLCIFMKIQEPQRSKPMYYSVSTMCEVMDLLKSSCVEPPVRRSSLSQISVMLEDFNIHPVFLERDGLKVILEIFDNCLIEKEYQNYPDSVLPIMNILKNLCYTSITVRQELSVNKNIFVLVLRGLLLFSGVERLRQDGAELLALLVYSDVIIGVPSIAAVKCVVSFPEIIVKNMSLPFLCHIHWKESQHTQPSVRDVLMKDASCSGLIRMFWTVQWNENISTLLSCKSSKISKDVFSLSIPEDMKLTSLDMKMMKASVLAYYCKSCLYDIQNATSHQSVMLAVDKLIGCLNTLNTLLKSKRLDIKTECLAVYEVSIEDFVILPWETTLDRFLTSLPSCPEDDLLLLNVLKLVRLVLRTLTRDKMISWITRILTDRLQPLSTMLSMDDDFDFSITGRQIRHEMLNILELVVTSDIKSETHSIHWSHVVQILVGNLKLKQAQHHYNMAYLDWFLSALVNITGCTTWNSDTDISLYEDVIVNVLTVLVNFMKPSSTFIGVSINRNCLLILNHVLYDTQNKCKGWEQLWYHCLQKVTCTSEEYTKLLTLWFSRDPLVRAAAVQLFSGFTITELGCDLLIDRLGMEYTNLWTLGFQHLLDFTECSLVREQAADLLSNLTSHGSRVTSSDFLNHLTERDFYSEISLTFGRLYLGVTIKHVPPIKTEDGSSISVSVCTPGLVKSVSLLLLNIFLLNPLMIAEEIIKSELFISLLDVFNQEELMTKRQENMELMEMYTSVIKLISHCLLVNWRAYNMFVQNQCCLNAVYLLLDSTLYDETSMIKFLRDSLWGEIFNLLSIFLCGPSSDSSPYNSDKEKSESDSSVNSETAERSFMKLKLIMERHGADQLFQALLLHVTDSADTRGFLLLTNLANRTEDGLGWLKDVFDERYGAAFCEILFKNYTLNNMNVKRNAVMTGLGSVLVISECAKRFALKKGLMDSLICELKEISVKLNLQNVDALRQQKKKLTTVLSVLERLYQLITNFMCFSSEVKSYAADVGLPDIIHKLWVWCCSDSNTLQASIKLLCTFTVGSRYSCQSLTLSSSSTGFGLRKSPGNNTPLNSVINQITREMDQCSKTHSTSTLQWCLRLLENCCISSECRTVLSKHNFISGLSRLCPSAMKKRSRWTQIVRLWLHFLLVFTSYPEGQLSVAKEAEVLEMLITSCKSYTGDLKLDVLGVCRNICLNPNNRTRLLSSALFLNTIKDILNLKQVQEVALVAVMVWSLAADNQKGKLVFRSSGIESTLNQVRNHIALTGDKEVEEVLTSAIDVLSNR